MVGTIVWWYYRGSLPFQDFLGGAKWISSIHSMTSSESCHAVVSRPNVRYQRQAQGMGTQSRGISPVNTAVRKQRGKPWSKLQEVQGLTDVAR